MTTPQASIAIVTFGCLGALAELGCNGCGGGTLTGTGGTGGPGVIHTGAAGVVGSAGITGDTGTAGNFGGDSGRGGFISTGMGGWTYDCGVPGADGGAPDGSTSAPPPALGLAAPIVYPDVTIGHELTLDVAVGDATGDGAPDLITVDMRVKVRANDGGGRFGPPFDASGDLGEDSSVYPVAAGDLDGDRYADVVFLHSGRAYPDVYAAVLMNDGAGNFDAVEDALVGSGSGRITLLDVDGDGDLDILVLSQKYNDEPGTIAVLLNQGGGSFALPVRTPAGPGQNAFTLAAGDLDGDGLPDLALADSFNGNVRVMVNVAAGRFVAANTFPAGVGPIAIGIGDVDGDGKPDIAIANDVEPIADINDVAGMRSTAGVMRNLGNGVFAAPVDTPVGVDVWDGVLEDLNGDGKPDIAVIDHADTDAAVLYNNGNGTFAVDVRLTVGGMPQEITAADVNGDGRPDLIVRNESGDAAVVLSRGAHLLAAGTIYRTGAADPDNPTFISVPPVGIAIGDLTGDGKPDVLVSPTLPSNAGMRLLPNLGAATFGAATILDVPVAFSPAALAIADLDGDGRPDVASGNDAPCVTLNGGGGTFIAPRCYTDFDSGTAALALAVGDVNGDGRPDLVSAQGRSVRVLTNMGSGTFSDFWRYGDAAWSIVGAKLGDLNLDGDPDLVVVNGGTAGGTGSVAILANPGDGEFYPWFSILTGSSPVDVAIADFNRDGWNDLAIANATNRTCSGAQGTIDLVLSYADGGFHPTVRYGGGGYAAIAVADVDGDGAPDLLALEQMDVFSSGTQVSSLKVFLNDGDGRFAAPVQYATGGTAPAMAVGDLDGDGRPDFAIASRRGTVSVLLNGPR